MKSNSKQSERRLKLPLVRKLSLGFWLVFLLLFAIFNTSAYFLTKQFLLETERQQLERVVETLSDRLSQSEEELSLATLSETLYRDATSDDLIATDKGYHLLRIERDVTNMMYFNQELYLYDRKDQLLFTTDISAGTQTMTTLDTIEELTVNGRDGYSLTVDVLSQANQEKIGRIQLFHDLEQYHDLSRSLLGVLLLLEFISLGVALLLLILGTRNFLKPLNELHDLMTELANHPDKLSLRANIKTGDEIEELSEIFNSMLDEIEGYSHLQSRFVSDISHELRTPIAVIDGHLNLLRRWGKNDPVILEEGLAASYHETQRMSLMIQDMLNMVRVQGNIDQHLDAIADLYQSSQTVVENFRVLHPEFVINLTQDGREGWVKMYQPHLEQVLTILLDNAIKYSLDDKTVSVSIRHDHEKATVSVSDKGQGISEEDLQHIFKRFYRTDQSRTRLTTQSGLGLGLSILHQLVQAYHCTITVDSQLNQGTTFTLVIPLVEER